MDLSGETNPAQVRAASPAEAAQIGAPRLASFGSLPSIVTVIVRDAETGEGWRCKVEVEPGYEIGRLPELPPTRRFTRKAPAHLRVV